MNAGSNCKLTEPDKPELQLLQNTASVGYCLEMRLGLLNEEVVL